MQTVRITTSQNIDIDYEIAGLGERVLGRLIDLALLTVLLLASLILYKWLEVGSVAGFQIIFIIGFTLFAFYDLLCESIFNGQSLGKHLMKIKVISLDGCPPTLGQYLMRWLFRIVDFLLTLQVGAVIAVVLTEKSQRLGDIVAGTTLVSTKPRTNIQHLAFAPVSADYKPMFLEAGRLNHFEVALIHEVINNVKKSDNFPLLHATATRFKRHLNIVSPAGMGDLDFLEILIADYNFAETSIED